MKINIELLYCAPFTLSRSHEEILGRLPLVMEQDPMLKVRLYSKGVHVGDAHLEATDPPMGCAGGRFAPLAPYAAIQPAVRRYWEEIKRNHDEDLREARARFDALDWMIVAEDGAVLECNGGIDLYDFEELGEGAMELHIFCLIKPDGAYLRYFSGDRYYRKYYNLP